MLILRKTDQDPSVAPRNLFRRARDCTFALGCRTLLSPHPSPLPEFWARGSYKGILNMSVSVGFIGAGNINRYHMKNAQAAGLKLVAVADVVASAADDAKKQYEMSKSYSDYHE